MEKYEITKDEINILCLGHLVSHMSLLYRSSWIHTSLFFFPPEESRGEDRGPCCLPSLQFPLVVVMGGRLSHDERALKRIGSEGKSLGP